MINLLKIKFIYIFWFVIIIMVIIILICLEGYKIFIIGLLMKVEIKNNNIYIFDVYCKLVDDDIGLCVFKNGELYCW